VKDSLLSIRLTGFRFQESRRHNALTRRLPPEDREDSVLLLVDHQALQFANLHSHEPQLVVNNVVVLANTAKLFGVPTILSTVLDERGNHIIEGMKDVSPDHKPINRTFIKARRDKRLVEALSAARTISR